jgi:hypothetical protein
MWAAVKTYADILTGDGELWEYRFIYLQLFILYLTVLPEMLHPWETG